MNSTGRNLFTGLSEQMVAPQVFTQFYVNNLVASVNGTSVNSAFPVIKKMTSYSFQTDVALIGLNLSTSIVNQDAALAGVFIAANQSPTLDISNSSDLYFSHMTFQNSSVAYINPTSRSNGLSFGGDSGIRLNSGVEISIYMACANNASDLLAATLTIIWSPLT